jgi:thiol-disulfide isomerase/thioredoxin
VTGVVVLLVVLAVATAFGLHRRRVNGRFRAVDTATPAPAADTAVLTAEDIGAELGERATLVQFSSAFCAPCRATRRTLDEVTGMVDGVAHVEIDAEARLELVRRLHVVRTPTVLVLDAQGHEVRRATGAPRTADVVAALGEVL